MRKGIAVDPEIAKKGVMEMLNAPGLDPAELEAKTMQVGINPQGGYWVRTERLSKTVKQVFETSPMRALCDIVTTSSDSVEMIIDDDEGDTGGATTETATRVVTGTPEIGLLTIFAHEQYAAPKVTQQLLDDAGFDVGSYVQRKTSRKMGRTENTWFVTGDGLNKAKGILAYPAWTTPETYERGKLEQIASLAATDFTADGMIDIQNALKEEYQSNATWMMRRQSWKNIIKLKESGSGAFLFDPQLLRNGAGQIVILGRPVVFGADVPAVAAGSLSAIYGDFRESYTIVDKIGAVMIRDIFTDKGRVIFYTSQRTGGALTNYEGLKVLKTAVIL